MTYSIHIHREPRVVTAGEVVGALPPSEGWGVFEETQSDYERNGIDLRSVHVERAEADARAATLNETDGVEKYSGGGDFETLDCRVSFFVGAVALCEIGEQVTHRVGYNRV